jgi:hypothetical protein
VDVPLLQATSFACLCAAIRDASDRAKPVSFAPATAAVAAASASISAFKLSCAAHEEACLLIAAGLHVVARVFDPSTAASASEHWQRQIASWAVAQGGEYAVNGSGSEALQLAHALKLVASRCSKWLEKAAKIEEAAGVGSSSASTVDMTAMD